MHIKEHLNINIIIIVIGIFAYLFMVGGASASTWTVCASGCDYTMIQNAINNASAGDTILVRDGTYFENVIITKQLTLSGIGMPVVDARGSGSAITLSADGIALQGFTAIRSGLYYGDAGINVTSSSNTLSGNNASNNYDGIDLWSSSNNNILNGNNANSNNYTGIYLDSSSNNTLNGNKANSNNYTGIYLYYSSNDTLISNNASNNIYYGIYLSDSSNNKIYNNIFNNTENVNFYDTKINTWNITRQSSTNIIGGPYLGGNFWANPNGKGFSRTCTDSDKDGICDSPYTLDSNNIDYLPLVYKPTTQDNIIPFPGFTTFPTDPDSDGLYEDINGNGRKDFSDVVLFFDDLEWVAANEPVASFDFNGNGRIDFDAVVRLFEEL